MKILVILAFIAILGSLAGALYFMMRRPTDADAEHGHRARNMAWALTLRIGLSVLLFALILISYLMGWIQPTGLPSGN